MFVMYFNGDRNVYIFNIHFEYCFCFVYEFGLMDLSNLFQLHSHW